MKKNKIVSLVVVLVALLTMVLPMTANAAGENATLNINAPAGHTLTNTDFKAYKVFDVTVNGASYAYTPVAGIAGFLTANPTFGPNLKAYLEGTPNMNALNKALTAYAATSGLGAGITPTQNGASGVRFSNMDFGYYLIVGKTTINGEVVTTYSNLYTVDKVAPTAINIKADAPSIDKNISDKNLAANSPEWAKETDVNIGDDVYFRITSAVPNMVGYSSYQFIVNDTLDTTFTLAAGFAKANVIVEVNGTAYSHYSVAVAGQKLTITFDSTEFVKLTTGHSIVIRYSAILNETAKIAPLNNFNKVDLEYSNNPYTTGKGKTPEKFVHAYTFRIDALKVNGKDQSALAGAKFQLKKNGNAISFYLNVDGSYSVATAAQIAATTNITTTLVSPATGEIAMIGLDAGTYTLTETEAPAGFNKISDKTIIIVHSGSGAYTVKVDSETPVNGNGNVITIENNSGLVFPGTGGVGTTIFYVVSAILTVGLAAFFILRKKKNILDAE